ncbi:MAG: hypothetical protein ACPLSY_03190 [Moorellaceae bacterium]
MTGVRLDKAWVLIEAERWYDGLPCVRVLFSPEGDDSSPPVEEGCWLAGFLEWRDGEICGQLHKPRLTPFQEAVWNAALEWAKKNLGESNTVL